MKDTELCLGHLKQNEVLLPISLTGSGMVGVEKEEDKATSPTLSLQPRVGGPGQDLGQAGWKPVCQMGPVQWGAASMTGAFLRGLFSDGVDTATATSDTISRSVRQSWF